MTTSDERDYLAVQLRRVLPSVQGGAKPSLRLRSGTGEDSTNWLLITPEQYFRVVDALTTEPGITYRAQPHDITELTWPMWDACGIDCPAMIGADCPGKDGGRCPGRSSEFPHAAAEVVHGWTLGSGQSDTCGEADSPIGWNALFRNPDAGTHDGPMGAGVILSTDSQGFVYLTCYESADSLESEWADLQQREADYDRANCEECADGEPCYDHKES